MTVDNLNKKDSNIEFNNKKLISYSRFSSFMNCPHKYDLHYRRRVKPIKESVKFTFGKAVHEALAYYYGMTCTPDEAIDYFTVIWREASKSSNIDFGDRKVTKAMIKDDPTLDGIERVELHPDYFRDMGLDMLESYFDTYEGEKLKIIGVEESFTTSFKNPKSNYTNRKWELTGIVDLILQDANGDYEIWDHKTMAKSIKLETMELSHQISCYYLGVADLLGIPVTKIKKAVFNILYKTAGYPCVRLGTTRSEEQINTFLTQLTDVSNAMANPKIFQNISFACAGCEYYKWCNGDKDGYYEDRIDADDNYDNDE